MDLSDSDDEITEVDVGQCLFDLLVDLKLRSVLNAKQACCIAYWATLAGAKGYVSKLAKQPGESSGHYSRKFDEAAELPKNDPRFYKLDVPVYSKEEGGRTAKPLVCLPLQMLLTEEVQATRNFDSDLREDAKHLPPVFENHPVVQRHREAGSDRIPVPVALYVDGIGYAEPTFEEGAELQFCENIFVKYGILCSFGSFFRA